MSIKNIITLLSYLGKPKASAPVSVSIEITSDLFNRCTLYNVTPERVIQDFISHICGSGIKQADSLAVDSVYEYLSQAYGDLHKVDSRVVKQHSAVV